MATEVAFYAFLVIGWGAAYLVVTLRNIMHSALMLVLALLSVAGVFMLMDADFLAMAQVLLYAGGITVLILFAIFLTQRIMGTSQPQTNEQQWAAFLACAVLGGLILMTVKGTVFLKTVPVALPRGTAPPLGELLLSKYVFPFEVASFVLLAAMVGVVVIAGKAKNS